MNAFEYYFSFFTLIIGLAVAAVAKGFGEMWQSRRRAPVGYVTPLLAAFLLLDLSRFWLGLWGKQEIAMMGPLALASGLCVALPYVFATSIMFPQDADEWPSQDAYYSAHSRPLYVALFASKVAAYGSDFLLFGWKPAWVDVIGIAIILAPFAVLIRSRSIKVHLATLIFLVAWSAFVFFTVVK